MIIPFFIPHSGCPHQCVFCDQKRITGKQSAADPSSIPATIRSFLATNSRTHAHAARRKAPDRQSDVQVAFYGGSFTALPPALQRAYLLEVRSFITSGAVRSIRISTRPDGITDEILALLREHQVTTVELGVQSLDDDVLRRSGRGHSVEHTIEATDLLKARGFSVGYQLMPGLPGDSLPRFRETIARTVKSAPDVVRIYPALVIRDTPLEQLFRNGKYTPLSLDDAVAWCVEAQEQFEAAAIRVVRIGLQHTETLSRPGTVIAGPVHPAFGQLVASARFLEKMTNALAGAARGSDAVLCVHPADLSSALGQKKRNLELLQNRTGIGTISVRSDPNVPRGTVAVDPACIRPFFRI